MSISRVVKRNESPTRTEKYKSGFASEARRLEVEIHRTRKVRRPARPIHSNGKVSRPMMTNSATNRMKITSKNGPAEEEPIMAAAGFRISSLRGRFYVR